MNKIASFFSCLCVVGAVFTASCVQIDTSSTGNYGRPRLYPAPLPSYVAGEYFTYNKNITSTVMKQKGDTVKWQFSNGAVGSGYRDFVLPFYAWENTNNKEKMKVKYGVSNLWPLDVGKTDSFRTTQNYGDNKRWGGRNEDTFWECRVDGTAAVRVPAGTFDTFRVSCVKYIADVRNWDEKITYYYSPDFGHFVKREEVNSNRTKNVEVLTGAGFDPSYLSSSDRKWFERRLSDTLERNRDGEASTWESSNKNISAMFTPLKSYRGSDGKRCREYKVAFNIHGKIRYDIRESCRAGGGRW